MDDRWLRQVANLTAAAQVDAVTAKLSELNLGFHGKLTPTIDKNAVTGVDLVGDNVTDITPLAALTSLQALKCTGAGDKRLADLSPLRGLPLKSLECTDCDVADLSPLFGMPLEHLDCRRTRVAKVDIKGLPLVSLDVRGTPVSDLSPLKDLANLLRLAL